MGVGPGLSAIRAAAAVYLWAGGVPRGLRGGAHRARDRDPRPDVLAFECHGKRHGRVRVAHDRRVASYLCGLLPASSRSWPPMFAVCVSPRQSSLRSPTIRFSCTALKPSVRVMVATSMAPPTPLVPVVHPWSVAVVLIRKIARSTQSCSGKNW